MFKRRNFHLMWIIAIGVLLIGIGISYHGIVYVYFQKNNWIKKNSDALTYTDIKINNKDKKLNEEMKKWLSNEENISKKYYRVVVKGYGSTGEVVQGYGVIKSNVKRFYVSEKDITIENTLLKFKGMIFCGQWELIPISADDYIYNYTIGEE